MVRVSRTQQSSIRLTRRTKAEVAQTAIPRKCDRSERRNLLEGQRDPHQYGLSVPAAGKRLGADLSDSSARMHPGHDLQTKVNCKIGSSRVENNAYKERSSATDLSPLPLQNRMASKRKRSSGPDEFDAALDPTSKVEDVDGRLKSKRNRTSP